MVGRSKSFEVQSIDAYRQSNIGGKREYFVNWKPIINPNGVIVHFSRSWETIDNVDGCSRKVTDFWQKELEARTQPPQPPQPQETIVEEILPPLPLESIEGTEAMSDIAQCSTSQNILQPPESLALTTRPCLELTFLRCGKCRENGHKSKDCAKERVNDKSRKRKSRTTIPASFESGLREFLKNMIWIPTQPFFIMRDLSTIPEMNTPQIEYYSNVPEAVQFEEIE